MNFLFFLTDDHSVGLTVFAIMLLISLVAIWYHFVLKLAKLIRLMRSHKLVLKGDKLDE